jgi:nucleotide-binding universal stress UspA family protein
MYDFLVDLEGKPGEESLLRFALALARQHEAHLTGIKVIAYDATLLAIHDPLQLLADEERIALARRDWWEASCREHGVQGTWEVHRGFHQAVIARRASFADVVLGRLAGRNPLGFDVPDLLERSLFADAVPVLLVPRDWAGEGGVRRIAIGWNGSVEAARAVKAASPLFARADEVIVFDGSPAGDAAAPAHPVPLSLQAWLQHHGVAARWQPLGQARGGVGPALHEQARALGADLLVIGAWSHARAGEWLLGGVTRHMLDYSRLPLLLAH